MTSGIETDFESSSCPRGPSGTWPWLQVLPPAVLALGIAVLVAITMWLQRQSSFAVDEWDILAHYYDGHYLTPYNGHLSIIPIAIFQMLAKTFGLTSYRPFGVVGVIIYLSIPVIFFASHRRRCDVRLAALGALGIAWLWAADGNVMYAFLMNFNIPVAMLFGAWWLIRFDDLRRDLWAVIALGVALASSSVGVVVALAICVELVLRRAQIRRLARFSPVVVAWLVWWWFRHDSIKPATFGERWSYAWHMTIAILSGFTLGWKPGAALVTVGMIVLVGVAWRRWSTVDSHTLAMLCTLVFFVGLTAFSRAGDIGLNPPDAHRYVWFGDVLLIAVALWCTRERRVHNLVLLPVLLVLIVGAIGLTQNLRDLSALVTANVQRNTPYLVEAEIAGPQADQQRIMPLNLIPVTVGQYLGLVRKDGSPVAHLPYGHLGSEKARTGADRLLIQDLGIAVEQVGSLPSCSAGWRPISKALPAAGIQLNPGDLVALSAPIRSDVSIRLRRLAFDFSGPPLGRTARHKITIVALPTDQAPFHWWMQLIGTPTAVAVCQR